MVRHGVPTLCILQPECQFLIGMVRHRVPKSFEEANPVSIPYRYGTTRSRSMRTRNLMCQFLIGMIRPKGSEGYCDPGDQVSIPYRYDTTGGIIMVKVIGIGCQFLIGMIRH